MIDPEITLRDHVKLMMECDPPSNQGSEVCIELDGKKVNVCVFITHVNNERNCEPEWIYKMVGGK